MLSTTLNDCKALEATLTKGNGNKSCGYFTYRY